MSKPIRSDGCTGFFDGYWRHCCVAHDYAYADGGTWADRFKADMEFMECIKKTVKEKTWSDNKADIISALMFAGVRIFGSPWCLPLYLWPRWRKQAVWGYGKRNKWFERKDKL